jgi:tetratricopeptide (TPR) repeat protein
MPTTAHTTEKLLTSARSKYRERDYHGALADYNAAISLQERSANELQPENAPAYAERGVIQYRLGDIIEAMSDYTQAIDLDPDLAIAYYRRAFIHYLVKNYDRAIADYDRAITLNPADARSYSSRGVVYRQLEREAEAIADFQQAATLFQQQGNLAKYQSTIDALAQPLCAGRRFANGTRIDRFTTSDGWESGMF